MRAPPWSTLLVALVIASIGLGPAIARACSCNGQLDLALPADGAVDVPTNTKVWLDGLIDCFIEKPQDWRILDPEGEEVAFTRQCVLSPNVYKALLTLHPEAPLLPDTTYTVERDAGTPWLRFTTGAGPDHVPPPQPDEVDREVLHARPGDCDDHWTRQATVTLDGEGALFVLDAGQTCTLDVTTIAGDVSEMSGETTLVLGRSLCHADNFPGGASRRAETTVRHGAFDLAGNFSGWTEPSALSLRSGCSLAAAPVAPTWLVLLALFGRRRSHRRPSHERAPRAAQITAISMAPPASAATLAG